jgi:hypothetical protein
MMGKNAAGLARRKAWGLPPQSGSSSTSQGPQKAAQPALEDYVKNPSFVGRLPIAVGRNGLTWGVPDSARVARWHGVLWVLLAGEERVRALTDFRGKVKEVPVPANISAELRERLFPDR